MIDEVMSRADLNAACALVASAGLATGHADSAAQLVAEVLDQVADIRAEAERLQQKRNEIIEQCAKVCEMLDLDIYDADMCADAIRALKE
jgi:proteasome assembly chaperone (PAC2) family protein